MKGGLLAARPVVVSYIVAESRLDAANLSKSAPDACEGIVYWQDSSVCWSVEQSRYGTSGDAWVAFALLPPRRLDGKVLEAGCSLANSVLALVE